MSQKRADTCLLFCFVVNLNSPSPHASPLKWGRPCLYSGDPELTFLRAHSRKKNKKTPLSVLNRQVIQRETVC